MRVRIISLFTVAIFPAQGVRRLLPDWQDTKPVLPPQQQQATEIGQLPSTTPSPAELVTRKATSSPNVARSKTASPDVSTATAHALNSGKPSKIKQEGRGSSPTVSTSIGAAAAAAAVAAAVGRAGLSAGAARRTPSPGERADAPATTKKPSSRSTPPVGVGPHVKKSDGARKMSAGAAAAAAAVAAAAASGVGDRTLVKRTEKNASPGLKGRASDAGRQPVEITGAAATDVPKPRPRGGLTAKELPLSQNQAQNLGLVAAAKDGKAKAKVLVMALKER